MKKMKKNKLRPTVFLAAGLLWGGFCQAQESINTNGGDATGSGGSVACSIGQVVYVTSTSSSGSVAQGVQQPYTILTTSVNNETKSAILLSAFPNPTTDWLNLNIADFNAANLNYQLIDLQGKVICEKKIAESDTKISMLDQAEAVYYLNILQNNQLIKSFKIIKN
jgi:Secretion system C-terminal sorting domain